MELKPTLEERVERLEQNLKTALIAVYDLAVTVKIMVDKK